MSKPSYIIGSGWWCDHSKMERRYHGDGMIRTERFHKIWYKAVDTFTRPEKILIIDSASPIPPPIDNSDRRIEILRLPSNPGHPSNHRGRLSGWTISALLGMQYAYLAGADYFVYLEQDALIYGEEIIEHCISYMKSPYMFGSGKGIFHPLQQSFFIVHRRGIEALIRRVLAIPARDLHMGPEKKFCIAVSPCLRCLPYRLFTEKPCNQRQNWLERQKSRNARRLMNLLSSYDELPVGSGGYAKRPPVDFSANYFYFQHGQKEEIEEYMQKYEQEYGPIHS